MATNVELRRSNGTNYNEVIHFKTSVAMVDGLLDENDKINASLLPSFVFGSMRFVTTINNDTNLAALHNYFNTFLATEVNIECEICGGDGLTDEDSGVGITCLNCGGTGTVTIPNPGGGSIRGCYAIVSGSPQVITISEGYEIWGEEGAGTPETNGQVTIEVNDWLICISDDGKTWAVINNTYRDATKSIKGIVQLATDQEGAAGTSSTKAMTPQSTVAAINARAYQHPTHTAKNEVFSDVETLSGLSVNSLGHVTSFVKQAIRVASESQTGVIQLASPSEAKAATENAKAISPLRVKEMIDRFASIELVQSLPTDMSDHPAGKLILLQI